MYGTIQNVSTQSRGSATPPRVVAAHVQRAMSVGMQLKVQPAAAALAPHVARAISAAQPFARPPLGRPPVQAKAAPGGRVLQRASASTSSSGSTSPPSQVIAIHPSSQGISAMALRATGVPDLYWRFIYPGGTVYRRSSTDPLVVLGRGWQRAGYSDLIRHTTVAQGAGSSWIATTRDVAGMNETYGLYAFEIDLEWHQGVDVNLAYSTIEGRRNPHAEQNEIAVWRNIDGDKVTAVWVPRKTPQFTGTTFADYYDRYSRQAYIEGRADGSIAHPPA
jgi:hypothetical protein